MANDRLYLVDTNRLKYTMLAKEYAGCRVRDIDMSRISEFIESVEALSFLILVREMDDRMFDKYIGNPDYSPYTLEDKLTS